MARSIVNERGGALYVPALFDGWCYDYHLEKTPGILIRKVAAVAGIAASGFLLLTIMYLLCQPYIVSWPNVSVPILMGIWFVILVVLLFGRACVGYYRHHPPPCTKCGKSMAIKKTIPTVEEARSRRYKLEESGNSYVFNYRKSRMYYQVYNEWFACKTCKRYVLFESRVLVPVGSYRAFKKKEEYYQKIAKR